MKSLPAITKSFWIVPLLYFVLLAPMALDFHFYYPDEIHYTDAAIEMLQSGDYLTPVTGGGELRFKKPIITYWFVLLGFKIFGINAFGARFFFLLVGAFVPILVYNASKIIYSDKRKAWLAGLIMASNITFIMSSMRSIPDILLCFFGTVSLLGFAGILKYGNHTPRKYLWSFFLGIALAFEVKGIPALIFGGFSILFLFFNSNKTIRARNLFYWPPVVSAIFIGSFWFVIMFILHKEQFIESFYNDQIGDRLTGSFYTLLGNIGLSLGVMLALLLPWISFVNFRKSTFKSLDETQRLFFSFALIFGLSFLLISGTVFKFYDRYLLPVVPISSILLGALITSDQGNKIKSIQVWILVVMVLNLLLLAGGAFVSVRNGSNTAQTARLVIAIVLTLLFFYRSFTSRSPLWLAMALILIPFNLSISTGTISFPTEGEQLKTLVSKARIQESVPIAFIGNHEVSSKLRISGNGALKVVNLDSTDEQALKNYNIIVLDQSTFDSVSLNSYECLGSSTSWSAGNTSLLIKSLFTGNFAATLDEIGDKHYLLKKNE